MQMFVRLYVRTFISPLVELLEPFHKLLKKGVSFILGEEQSTTFQKVKNVLNSSPIMISLVKGLINSLFDLEQQIYGALLFRRSKWSSTLPLFEQVAWRNRHELSFYRALLSRAHLAKQKLQHYFLSHSLNLVTRFNLLKYPLSRPAMSRRARG